MTTHTGEAILRRDEEVRASKDPLGGISGGYAGLETGPI
jgi:hypothetical protein